MILRKNHSAILFIVLILYGTSCLAQRQPVKKERIFFKNDRLYLENARVRFTYNWNDGALQLLKIENIEQDKVFIPSDKVTDFYLDGEVEKPTKARLNIKKNAENHAEAEIIYNLGKLQVKNNLRLYHGAQAVRHTYFLKGKARAKSWEPVSENSRDLVESEDLAEPKQSYLMSLKFPFAHSKFKAVTFKGATDHHDNLVEKKEFMPYRAMQSISANLLFISLPESKQTLFILKEAPLGYDQQAYPGFDFSIDNKNVSLVGLGIAPEEIYPQQWTRAYGYALGISGNSDFEQKRELLKYQKSIRPYKGARDLTITANTWGDRSKDSRMNEEFIVKEINQARALGLTHVQLDDGWQQGLSRNSASKAGSIWDDWQKEDWQPHRERFPNGFQKITSKGKELGVSLGLWFNPSKTSDYANWSRDAEILINYYEKYGITMFKIDGIELNTKQSEIRLRNFFEKVDDATSGAAVFNLDVTAGARGGYFYFTEFGSIFLENRYTDWGNYYPYRSLRNLWMLSSYIPAEKFQIEFLNVYRNRKKYTNEKFAPYTAGLDYAFAVSMPALPLAWMELSGLRQTPESFDQLIKNYKDLAPALHKAIKIPIAQQPDGRAFTGFLALGNDQQHYLLAYREATENSSFEFELPITFKNYEQVLGDPVKVEKTAPSLLKISFEDQWDFVVLKLNE